MTAPDGVRNTGIYAANRAESRIARKCRKEQNRRKAKDKHAAPTALTFTQQGSAERVRVPTDAAADGQVHLPERSRRVPRTP